MNAQTAIEAGGGAGLVKQEFGSRSVEVRGETASAAVAAQAQAAVQARYIMALQRPRDIDAVRVRLLAECKRPGFADAAIYLKPIGDGIEGPSIRFAEACIRLLGNILVETPTVYDDSFKRIVRVVVTDLETNATIQSDVVIDKTVERRDSADRVVVGERTNKYGKRVYIVQATEDELLNKVNALLSKAIRTNGLRLVPADLLEEALDMCRQTTASRDAKDPGTARKKLADVFAALGVLPADLKAYLGHDLAMMTAAELSELRKVYAALQDGDTSWSAAMAARRPNAEAPPTATAAGPGPTTPTSTESSAPAQAPTPDAVDALLADIAAATSEKALDALLPRARAEKSPRRNEIGAAINARRKALKESNV